MQIKTQEKSVFQETVSDRAVSYVFRFLVMWLSSLFVIGIVSLLSDINWSRRYLERSVGEALGREVSLGKLAWNIGSNGIAIETNKFTVKGKSSEPFFTSGHSEIGVSVGSLIARKPVITYIEAANAEIDLVKTGMNQWNFDDLLKPGPEIRLLQINNGKIKITDTSPEKSSVHGRLEPMRFEKVELKLNFPHKNRKRPFFLSFSIPNSSYTTTAKLAGLGIGELEKWSQNQYTFQLDAHQVNPRDVERLLDYLALSDSNDKLQSARTKEASVHTHSNHPFPHINNAIHPLSGFIDFAVQGSGTFEKGIQAVVSANTNNAVVDHPAIGPIKAGSTQTAVTANLSQSKLCWQDLVVKLRGIEIHSSGALSEWLTPKANIKAVVTGQVPDLGVLQDIIEAPQPKSSKRHNLSGLTDNLRSTRLTGRAHIDVKVTGTIDDTNLTTIVKTRDLAISDMLTKAHQQFPILFALGLSDRARVESDLKIDDQQRIEIIDGKLIGPGTNLSASGWLDLNHERSKLVVDGGKISLRDTAISINDHDETYKQLVGWIKLPGKNSFHLDGVASAHGVLTTDGSKYALDGEVKLHDALFDLKDNSLKLDKVNGQIIIKQSNAGGNMKLAGITGAMGDGKFQMDGAISLTRTPIVDLTLHATRFDLKHLSSLVKLFQIRMPVLSERQLFGRVKDVVLKVSGTAYAPKIFFTAVPDDLYYQPDGLTRPLRAKTGVIVYDNDQLILRDVAFIANGKSIVTSLTIDKVSSQCLLTRVKTKTDSIEIADLNYYLSSPVMPPPLRKAYTDFLAQHKITGLKGKGYGDILCLMGKNGEMTFDGLVGCFKTALNIGRHPITKLDGIFAASGDQLLIQDLKGYLNGSKFSLDGYIDKYRSKTPNWRAELAANLSAKEMLDLIPSFSRELKSARLSIQSKGPLTLRAKVQGDLNASKVSYSLIADKKDRLVVETPLGKVHQPDETPLTLDGQLDFDKTKITIGDTHLLVGETLINMNGEFVYPEPEMGGPSKWPEVSLNFKLPQRSPIKTLIGMVEPQLEKDFDGSIIGTISLSGDMRNPIMVSDLSFNDVDAKPFNISGLNGRITTSEDSKKAVEKIEQADLSEAQEDEVPLATKSKIEVDSAKIRQLPVTELKATVAMIAGSANTEPVIKIDNGKAKIAEGVMHFQARLTPDSNGIWAKADFKEISAARIADELVGRPEEISGKGQASIEIETKGKDSNHLIKNLKGHGQITIDGGVVARFSDLQTRLTQYNLLTQGIFGFNFNNLLQSVWPVRTGEFTTLNNSFSFGDGFLNVDELRFSGKDMRIWGKGVANLETHQVQLEIAGKIPRVQGSLLGGPMGTFSRSFTLQKFMKVVTFGKLENLPALPVIGAIATDKPRTFTFIVDSILDNPKLIARSIEKTFKWLPNRPEATAHPVPGVQYEHQM